MKLFKKFLIWLAIALGILLVCFLGMFAFMYFSPGSSILGYEYVLTNDKTVTTYDKTTDLSVEFIEALEVTTNKADIYILPNTESEELKIERRLVFSGLARSVNADLNVLETIETKSFEEKENTYSTFRVVVNEPTGWISENLSYVVVRVPTNITLNTIYAKSNGGDVYYISDKDESILTCSDLYLKTSHLGLIDIKNNQPINNYYLTSGEGRVVFSQTDNIACENMKFYTNTGALDITNANGDATLNLNCLYIYSNNDKIGPKVVINKLNGNLNIDAKDGYYKINEIGSFSNNKTIAITLAESDIKFGTVYGYISLLSNSTNAKNNIEISNLNYTAQTHTFETGRGHLKIHSLTGNVAVDATSGDVSIAEATATSSVYVYTTSGDINVNYIKSKDNNKNTNLTAITHTGDVNISNMSCSSNIRIMENSSHSSLNIGYCAVAFVDHVVEAKNRKVNLKVTSLENKLRFRLLTTKAIQYIGPEVAYDILRGDPDYLLETIGYENFDFSYRFGYVPDEDENTNQGNNSFHLWGKILIYTTNDIFVQEDVLA